MIKRFDMIGQGDCEMSPGEDGEYVSFKDYQELATKYTTLKFRYDDMAAKFREFVRMIDP